MSSPSLNVALHTGISSPVGLSWAVVKGHSNMTVARVCPGLERVMSLKHHSS